MAVANYANKSMTHFIMTVMYKKSNSFNLFAKKWPMRLINISNLFQKSLMLIKLMTTFYIATDSKYELLSISSLSSSTQKCILTHFTMQSIHACSK